MTKLPYRLAVNCIITNSDDQFLVIQLQEYDNDQWKFVGGGIEDTESNIQAAYREIKEETGILQKELQFIGESTHIQQYDFPLDLEISKKYKGQKKHQLIFKYTGNKNAIKIQEAELKNYKWVQKTELKKYLIFSGQYQNAKKIIDEFDL